VSGITDDPEHDAIRGHTEVLVIRSALKAGLKKVVGRVMGVTAPPPPPPAPSWSTAAPASPTHVAVDAPPVSTEAATRAPAPTAEPEVTLPAAEPVIAAPVVAQPPAAEPVVAEVPPAAPIAEAPPGRRRGRAKKVTETLVAAVPEPPAEVAAPPEDAPLRPVDDTPNDTAGPALTMEALQDVIDEMVRPALQGDGGDITLLRIEGRKVYVRLVGACSTCPSSIVTLKMGVEALLKEEFPSLEELVQES
jgi:Fe-S cluster biogenesis protein NfuA